jgi:hypothetical protein
LWELSAWAISNRRYATGLFVTPGVQALKDLPKVNRRYAAIY